MSKILNPIAVVPGAQGGVEIHLPEALADFSNWDASEALSVLRRLEVMNMASRFVQFFEQYPEIPCIELGARGVWYSAPKDAEAEHHKIVRDFCRNTLHPLLNELNKPFLDELQTGKNALTMVDLNKKNVVQNINRAAKKILNESDFWSNVQAQLNHQVLQEITPRTQTRTSKRRL